MANSSDITRKNELAGQSSLYLRQHSRNPIHWQPWSSGALESSLAENKLLVISIGYSSCHWCHVMENESFSDTAIAGIMNSRFINIKIDREERPDLDAAYMEAARAMGIQGGWPLNIIAAPGGKPIYAGTYFSAGNWAKLLEHFSSAFRENPAEFIEHSEKLIEAASRLDNSSAAAGTLSKEDTDIYWEVSKKMWDPLWGGYGSQPKFPLPVSLINMIEYGAANTGSWAEQAAILQLDKMAAAGIYDQLGGGWARYSTDRQWAVPHFEKMLYDNALLLRAYSEAYSAWGLQRHKKTAAGTADFMINELMHETGLFCSSIDADSGHGEGEYYTWAAPQIKEAAGELYSEAMQIYGCTENGNWEKGLNTLLNPSYATENKDTGAAARQITSKMLLARGKRQRPVTDTKILAAWNGMAVTGLCKAYTACGDKKYLEAAQKTGAAIKNKMMRGKKLSRLLDSCSAGHVAFLDDYAFACQGFIELYQLTGHEKWIEAAAVLAETSLEIFSTETELLRYSAGSEAFINKPEIYDNVTPSSNSQTAKNLFALGHILEKHGYTSKAQQMLSSVSGSIPASGPYMSNWMSLAEQNRRGFTVIKCSTSSYMQWAAELKKHYNPYTAIVPGCADGADTADICASTSCYARALPLAGKSIIEKYLKI
jgi:uncharacterized protein